MQAQSAAPTLKHRTLAAAICDRLRKAILDGTHPSGMQLRQDALAATYGVSRIPVREALFQLEAEGLVRIVPHKGAVVSGLSIEEVNDVFDLRALLEPRLLEASGPKLMAEDFARIDRIQSAFVTAVKARDVVRWGELNADFHMALYAQAALPRTLSVVQSLLQTSDRYTRVQLSTPAAMLRAEREHHALAEYCRNGDFEAARTLLAAHVESVRADLVTLLGAAGDTPQTK
jgi:DNA-binding GntR family transcriptional regulator